MCHRVMSYTKYDIVYSLRHVRAICDYCIVFKIIHTCSVLKCMQGSQGSPFLTGWAMSLPLVKKCNK